MIDWLTFRARLKQHRPLHGGYVASISIDHDTGEETIDWRSLKRIPVVGSHDRRIHVRSCAQNPLTHIEISGNPAKFFQGHNVFGSEDVVGLTAAMYRAVCTRLGMAPSANELYAVDAGAVQITRLDLTRSYDLGSLPRVLSAIRALEHSATLKHRGRGSLINGSTLIFGRGSRRWALLLYAKGQELRVHPLPEGLASGPLLEYAARLLRAEIRFQAMELKKRNLHFAAAWMQNVSQEQHGATMEKLHIAAAFMLDPDVIASLPARLQTTYQLWKDGHDLRAMLSRATFYRYRAELAAHGVDIAVQQPRNRAESNVVPLPLILHGYPAQVPDWAIGTPLYFEPRRTA